MKLKKKREREHRICYTSPAGRLEKLCNFSVIYRNSTFYLDQEREVKEKRIDLYLLFLKSWDQLFVQMLVGIHLLVTEIFS